MKKLANQYIKDYWQLTDNEREEVVNIFLFFSTEYCNGEETEVILRGGGLVGKSYDNNDIVWA